MTDQIHPAGNMDKLTLWERWASLLGRLIIVFSMVYVTLIFYTWTWRHFAVPKTASFQFLMLMLAACWLIVACKRRMVRSSLAAPAAMLGMMMLVSCLVAVNLPEAFEQNSFYLLCLLFAVLIPKFLTSRKDFEAMAYIMGLLCILVDIYGLAQRFNWVWFFNFSTQFGIEKFTEKPVSFMGNENYTAEFMNIGVPICFTMMLCHWRKPSKLFFYTVATLFNVVNMYYIDCNATYFGLLVSMPIAAILFIRYRAIPSMTRWNLFGATEDVLVRRARHALVLLILAISIFAAITASFRNPIRFKMASIVTWMDINGDHVPDGVAPYIFRLQCMDAAIRNIRDVPLFGIGAGNFKVVHPLFENQLERKVLGEETLARKVHNDHLFHAVEFGVLGLYAWYWIIAATVFAGFQSIRILYFNRIASPHPISNVETLTPDDKDFYFYIQLGLLTAVLTGVASCAFGHTFVIPSSSVSFWWAVGVTAAAYQLIRRAEKKLPLLEYGTTAEPLSSWQRIAKLIPSPVLWLLFFILILPIGALNIYQFMGETYLKYGMGMKDRPQPLYQQMFQFFDKARRYYPYQMETYYILGRYYIDAVIDIERYKKLGDAGTQAMKQVGLEPEKLRQYVEEGVVTLQTDIFMNPNYKWAHNNLGVLYDRLTGILKGAYHSQAAYNRVLTIDNEQIYAHYNLGLGAMNRTDYKTAIDELQMALVVDPGKTEIYRYLSGCFTSMNEYQSSITALDKYLGLCIRDRIQELVLDKGQPLKRYEPIIEPLQAGNLGQALREAKRIIQFEDKEINLNYLFLAKNIAVDNSQSLQVEANKQIAYDAIQRSELVFSVPNEPEYFLLYAQIYYACGHIEKTAEKYEDYLRLRPNDIDYRTRLTNIYTSLQQFDRALTTFQKIIEVAPNEWSNHITYANLLVANRRVWGEVFEHIRRGIELGGDEARKFVVQPSSSNTLDQFIPLDANFQELLGPNFWSPKLSAPAVDAGTSAPQPSSAATETLIAPPVQEASETIPAPEE
ncbi:MAG: O-antigen ligase family protein [Candidatus Omnitrophota bacterium]